jgi:hypothetical protein
LPLRLARHLRRGTLRLDGNFLERIHLAVGVAATLAGSRIGRGRDIAGCGGGIGGHGTRGSENAGKGRGK